MFNILKTAFFVLFCVFGISAIVINELRIENTNLNTEITEMQILTERIFLEHEDVKMQLAEVIAELDELQTQPEIYLERIDELEDQVALLEYDNTSYQMLKDVIVGSVANITARHLEKIGDKIPKYFLGSKSTNIGSSVLESVEIPSSIKEIGYAAFGHCKNLKRVIFNEGLEVIGDGAFYNTNATFNYFPSTLKKIEAFAFGGYQCNVSIDVFSLPDGLIEIGQDAFHGFKDSVYEVEIPASITSLPIYAFNSFSNLRTVVIPNSVTRFGSYAFYYCTSLETIYYGGTEAQWNAIIKGSDWDINAGTSTTSGTYTVVYNHVA